MNKEKSVKVNKKVAKPQTNSSETKKSIIKLLI